MKVTHADRANWSRISKKKFKLVYVERENFKGYVSSIYIEDIKEPLILEVDGSKKYLADNGFTWLQLFPQSCNYALTTMFNSKNEIIQWYFDICGGNKVDSLQVPYYDDWYLDVVLLPSGKVLLLDEDELQEAFDSGEMTKAQYDLAYGEARKIIRLLEEKSEELPLDGKWYLDYINSAESIITTE